MPESFVGEMRQRDDTGRKKWLESLLKCNLLSVCSPRNSDPEEGGWGPVICIFFFFTSFPGDSDVRGTGTVFEHVLKNAVEDTQSCLTSA